MGRFVCLGWIALVVVAGPSKGHFHMLLPASVAVKKGETAVLTYQWGHPFEHQLFDAQAPLSLTVRAPDGKQTDLTSLLEKSEVQAGDKKVTAYLLRFKPEARGDYVFIARAAPVWMGEEGEYYEDTVKVVLHVQAQKGWDAATGAGLEWTPLTRPYGLRAGSIFQALVADAAKGPGSTEARCLPGTLVEVERYNPAAPSTLPPDELITQTVKTDPNGVATTTLPEPGWWSLTASVRGADRERDGKRCPARRRTTLWAFVDGSPAP